MFSFITIPANAITVNETKISNFQQDVSFSRLEKGMDIIIIKNGDKLDAITPSQRIILKKVIDIGTFHVGVVRDSKTKAHLYWSATGTQITKVTGKIYCKNTSIIKPKNYYSSKITEYKDLKGRYNLASGSTDSFKIPKSTKKVKVGWKNVYITTVVGGKAYLGDASASVKI